MTERGEVIAAHSPGGDALLIGAGRDNGRFCAYIFSAPGGGPSTSHARCSARSHGNRMTAKTTHRPYVLAAVMAAMFMIAIEATIVSTAMPRIVGQLGGLQLYSWVFSAFLLTQTATTVVFGKLSDLLGRKKVMLSGIAIFLFGSLLCGFAWSMPSMILFRLVQGVGAGAIQPIGMTIVGDLYSAHERGKIQGWLSSVWAISAVVGPLVGGLIVQHFSWAWIFWMNLPIGVLAAAGFWACLHENIVRQNRKIDHLSAGVFTIAIAAVMADLTAVSTSNWTNTAFISTLAIVSVALFVWQERRSPEPMISLKLWGRRPIAAANGASLLAGMTLIGLTTFLPVYVQGVMQKSALTAGFALSVMVLGWPMGATLAGRVLNRFGLRPILLTGGLLVPVGTLVFVALQPDYSPVFAGIGSWTVGFGMGLLSSASIVLIQEIVDWSERGSVTASFIFARSLGSTFGATIFGAVLNYGLIHSGQGAVSSDQLRRLLEGAARDATAGAPLRAVLAHSLHLTFVSMFVIALLTAAVTFLVPKIALGRRGVPAERSAATEAPKGAPSAAE
jgi:EmrB/QacA subfamily drug resistance transporter